MLLIDEGNAERYLRDSGRIATHEHVQIRELSGGVSNIVLLVSNRDGQPRFVLKQAREQLRVAEPWFCSIERIWREVDVIELCDQLLNSHDAADGASEFDVSLPSVLFRDPANYLFAMTAAPAHRVLKEILLSGECHRSAVAACGRLLARLHAATWQHPVVAERLADRSFFEQLRVDPYYRHVAGKHPDLATELAHLIESLAEHPRCLVHGDFSPKNILVYPGALMLVDFEVGHFGDPAFDLGFFLSHLVLKAIRAGERLEEYLELTTIFLRDYQPALQSIAGELEYAQLMERTVLNFAGCLLARVDGKSKVDYLNAAQQSRARESATELLRIAPREWDEVLQFLKVERRT